VETAMQYKQINIREATMTDIPALTGLMNQLGYSTTTDEMKTRFINIQNHEDYKTFIAATDTQVVGMVGLTRNFSYEQNGIYVRVAALVTNHDFRQNGIGSQLMEAAENWAREIGAHTILLNCGNRDERRVAHQFYQKVGYQIKSSGFIKKL
jgi:GNAT superfamily N-acetyltransferase